MTQYLPSYKLHVIWPQREREGTGPQLVFHRTINKYIDWRQCKFNEFDFVSPIRVAAVTDTAADDKHKFYSAISVSVGAHFISSFFLKFSHKVSS